MRSGILASSIDGPCGFSPAASRAQAQSRRRLRNLAMVRKMSAEAVSEKPMHPAAVASGMPASASARQ